EDKLGDLGGDEVVSEDQQHHDGHECENDPDVADQLFARGGDHTAEFGHHLAHEQRDSTEDVTTFTAFVPRVVLSRVSHGNFAHRYILCLRVVERGLLPRYAGQEGLEPPTVGFGDRCATNCATALGRRWVPPSTLNNL